MLYCSITRFLLNSDCVFNLCLHYAWVGLYIYLLEELKEFGGFVFIIS